MISLNQYISAKRSKRSKVQSSSSLKRFFRWVSSEDREDFDSYSLEYLSSGRDYFQDVSSFLDSLLSLGLAPMTISQIMTYVQHWLSWNEIIFSPLQSSMLRSKMPRVVTVRDEDIFDVQKIKSILSHSDVYLRALILVLVSSGMRIGEALAFTEEQIRGNEVHLRADQMKAGKPHIYFVSAEALQALDEWRKVRSEAIKRADTKTIKCLGSTVPRSRSSVFFYSYNVSNAKLKNAIQKAGFYERDDTTQWSRLTFHGFRKFADSVMKAHITPNLANALIGHFEAGDSSYRRYTLEQLRAAYAEVEPYLTIQAPPDYAENKNETRAQLASHDKLLVALVEENYQIKADNKVIKDTLDSLVRYLEAAK